MANIGQKLAVCFRKIVLCGRADEDDEKAPSLKIGPPTNFRREDIHVPGLTEADHIYLRNKAKTDAAWLCARPLESSPSGTFAERPPPPTYEELVNSAPTTAGKSTLNTTSHGSDPTARASQPGISPSTSASALAHQPEDPTQSSPLSVKSSRSDNLGLEERNGSGNGRVRMAGAALNRMRAHTRKISDSVRLPWISPMWGEKLPGMEAEAEAGSEKGLLSPIEIRSWKGYDLECARPKKSEDSGEEMGKEVEKGEL